MLQIKFNKFLKRTYLSDAAIACELMDIESNLLTVIVYANRHFWKSVEKSGYWYIKIDDLVSLLDCDEDELYDACEALENLGFTRVEQHGEYLWFFMSETAMSEKIKKDLEIAKSSNKNI